MQTETEKTVTKPAHKKTPWRNIGILFSAFAVMVLIVVFGFVLQNLLEINHQLIDSQASTRTQVQNLTDKLNDTEKRITTLGTLNNEINGIKQSIDQLSQLQKGNQEVIVVAYSHYLVKLANDYLQYTHNIPLSVKLLESADQELRTLSNPQYLIIRQKLAEDMAHLQSTPVVDVDGIYARLNALHGEVDQLPLIISTENRAKQPEATTQPQSWWRQGLSNSWRSLQQLVVIRYNENQKIPLLPEQQIIIKENAHALINQAVWGLLHGQQDIYLSALDHIQAMVKKYFVTNDTLTQAVLTQTENLKNLYIREATPQITALAQFQVNSQ